MRAKSAIPVPAQLRGAHPFVQATKAAIVGSKRLPDGRLDVGREPGLIYMKLSRPLAHRALRLAQALLAEAQRRGYQVVAVQKGFHRAGIGILIEDEADPIELVELTEGVPLTDAETERWKAAHAWELRHGLLRQVPRTRSVPSGRLKLTSPTFLSARRSSWSEGPRGPLEDKLGDVLEEFEQRAAAYAIRRREFEERQERLRQEQARRAEIEQARREQEIRTAQLSAEVAGWRGATAARAYAVELRARADDLDGPEAARVTRWAEWIESYADASDPTLNTGLAGLRR
jgi:hypothetical protein